MGKKDIQRQRMMKYFIDAAKQIVIEEGVKNVTARKIGEKAGYSYATIYNYFDDLNTLLIYCAFDFLEDCYNYLIKVRDTNMDAKEQIITYALAYFKYFVENPYVYELVFVEELGKPLEELMGKISRPSISILLRDSIAQCAKEGLISENDIDLLGELITSSIHGKLLFYIKQRDTKESNNVKLNIRSEIEYLLKIRRETDE